MWKSEKKMILVQYTEKVIKINLWIISKSHAHLQIITKTPMQSKKKKKKKTNQHKTITGVVKIRHLPIHFDNIGA